MIWHMDSILKNIVMVSIPGHEYNKLPLLQDHALLNRLKQLVTAKPTLGIMTRVQQEGSHHMLNLQPVQLREKLEKMNRLLQEYEDNDENKTEQIIEAIKATIEDEALNSGQVNAPNLTGS
jgi:DNA integrity scanning protein DisA with diadenylate cyclase activity